MANESEFPKSDGDVLYASEVNYLLGFGDATDGAYSDSGNLVQGTVYQYSTFSLTGGNTLSTTSTSGKPIIIYVQSNCTIAGTIDLNGKGYDNGTGGAAQTSPSSYGKTGTIGQNFQRDTDYGVAADYGNGGTFGAAADGGVAGTLSLSALQIYDANFNRIDFDSSQGGAGGGSGSTGAGGTSGAGGDGGNGGGSIIFVIGGDLNVTGATITATGGNGSNGGNGSVYGGGGGGGGGGAGGNIWIMYRGTLTSSVTPTLTAGSAGTGGTTIDSARDGGGGAGGASMASNGSAGSAGGAPGNGGAGGAGATGKSSIQKIINRTPIVVQTDTI